uniref:Uncharacterized protein n=1 Tax=Glossina palpalis gambiensis TaxID=67801 RepID=A0A1B0B1J7_9MUSC
MGHLSTSERVITTSVEQTESSLKNRLNNVAATGNELNEFPKKNGQKLMTSSNNVNSNVNYKTKYHTNLEEYTRNFKGDSVLGIQFKAPLKWDKIIMIFSFYLLSIFYLITYPLNKLRLPTILWGLSSSRSVCQFVETLSIQLQLKSSKFWYSFLNELMTDGKALQKSRPFNILASGKQLLKLIANYMSSSLHVRACIICNYY